jgi:hypothetical protein
MRGRALEQLPAEVVFKAFQLGADRGLSSVQNLSRTRKGLQLGCQDEGVNGAEIQVSHLHPSESEITSSNSTSTSR